ncbi:MAG: CPBP family glutamic-type intramembrane protease [Luteimonas sp.]
MTHPDRFYALLSPLLLVAICAAVQLIAGKLIGAWAWVPTMFCFWALIAWFTRGFSGYAVALARFKQGPGGVAWPVIAVAAGLLSLHGFLQHWTLLSEPHLVLAWLVFALVNPWFEESYWRGLLMDATASWGKAWSLLYSTAWFAASHPLIWGIHSLPLRKPEAIGALLLVGLLWGLVYQRTGRLRWCVAGHMLANLLGLAALVLLNLYDPTLR